jgi:hypothetical protein
MGDTSRRRAKRTVRGRDAGLLVARVKGKKGHAIFYRKGHPIETQEPAKYPVLSSTVCSRTFLKPPPLILHPMVATPFYKKHHARVSIAPGVLDSKST